MRSEELKSIEDYEAYLSATVAAWPPPQRVALAAAMAERWLPVYEAFAIAEEWGDPASLRRSLQAVWDHACGQSLAPAERARHIQLLEDSTPHMDDFEAYEPLAACMILHEALDCCGTADNAALAVRAALGGFEAVVPDWAMEPDMQPRLWKRVAARKELGKQLKLVERIGAIPHVDATAVEALRRDLRSAAFVGAVAAPSKPKAPPGLTNQAAFEQYRRLLTSHLNRPTPAPPSPTDFMFAMSIFCEWGLRYLHRLRAISGKYGPLADVAAQQALVARHRARDAANREVPDWGKTVLQVMGMNLANPYGEYDVKSLDQPHGYGPSLRMLWTAAKQQGLADADAWQSILAWAHHRPTGWEDEDRRKKKGRGHATPELAEHLARELTWAATDDLDCPWATEVGGVRWRVRLNDFPDEVMYSLLVGDQEVGRFHDWPAVWQRSS